jgi:hypothetical protein
MPADEVALLLFKGDEAEPVREVSERAEIPVERILETVRLDSIATPTATDGRSEPQPPWGDPVAPRSKGDRHA